MIFFAYGHIFYLITKYYEECAKIQTIFIVFTIS